ncbi:MAG TPA: ChpI protein [Vicinamibacteria bacterium]|nr:ChpI protein [Vicinamibacteria bacterium]
MKVGISLPDSLYRSAERVAKRLRVPRSQLYARAIEAYLKEQAGADVTERLNAVYGKPGTEPDPVILAHSLEMLRRTQWEE